MYSDGRQTTLDARGWSQNRTQARMVTTRGLSGNISACILDFHSTKKAAAWLIYRRALDEKAVFLMNAAQVIQGWWLIMQRAAAYDHFGLAQFPGPLDLINHSKMGHVRVRSAISRACEIIRLYLQTSAPPHLWLLHSNYTTFSPVVELFLGVAAFILVKDLKDIAYMVNLGWTNPLKCF